MPAAPLAGVRVLEVGNYMAGPFCAMQLADLGADVVKVESPASGGDEVRKTEPFLGPEQESSTFVRLNRNKRSLALDLKSAVGKQVFRELVERSDVVVENLRPGTMADLELDYPRLARLNPGLVYVAASGWGLQGPYSQLAGLDIVAQGMSGLMSITGEPGGDPVKVGVPVTDLVCALYGALACVAALHSRDRDGRGQLLDVSLFESGVSLAIWEAGRYFATGEVPAPLGSAHQTSAPYQAVRATDGWFTVGATSPRNWEAFCDVLGQPQWKADERFQSNSSRHRHRAELVELIEQVTGERPAAEWVEKLQAAGVPCGSIHDYAQVFDDPHLRARDFFWEAPHSTLGSVRQLGSPMRFGETPVERRSAGPRLGEHSGEVLRELGRSAEEIAALVEQRVIIQAPCP
jgi:crotonobetainyl-CoA:carnitine CoA-transferase CaiB-like acyl-CoA transferase